MIHSTPVIEDPTPEMQAQLDAFRDEHMGEPLGKVANRILFEDDKVRIWEMKLEPGEHSDLHRHEHDYYLMILSGDRVAGVIPSDQPGQSFVGVVPPAGNTVGLSKGGVEWAWNVGEQTYHEILLELKNT